MPNNTTSALDAAIRVDPAIAFRFLHSTFERQAARRPNHIAVECSAEALTYAELDGYANQIARLLQKRGVGPGRFVGLYVSKSCRAIGAILGILKAGAAYVPLDPRFPADRIEDILDDCDAVLAISDATLDATVIRSAGRPVLCLDGDHASIAAECPSTPLFLPRGLSPSQPCYAIYTSGSTGRPKGVVIAHRNAMAFIGTLRTVYRIAETDRIYHGFSIAFDASVEEIWAALSIGGTLVMPEDSVARSPAEAADFIAAKNVTYFSTVPTFLAMIDRDLPSVRILILGGESCTSQLVDRWARPGRRMLNTYGPTETTVVATWAECVAGQPVTIGVALPGYTVYVLDDAGHPVGVGEAGELHIGGAGVAVGYLNLPELTRERFIAYTPPGREGAPERVYRTSDLVRVTPSGALEFIGRSDAQIKIRGFRVELAEIETLLTGYDGIQAAAVSRVESAGAHELAAYVMTAPNQDIDRNALAAFMRSRLPEYMIPKFLDVMDTLPLMTSGKVDRRQLPVPTMPLLGAHRAVEPPADALEQAIVETWQESLGVQRVSVTDDFFTELLGHSLTAARMSGLLRQRLPGCTMSVRDVYQHRTVRALAVHLRAAGAGQATPSPKDGKPKAPRNSGQTAATDGAHPFERWTVVALQTLALPLLYSLMAAPFAYAILIIVAAIDGRVTVDEAIGTSIVVSFAFWPSLVLFSIAAKWLIIGRFKAGQYPLWSFYYFRWWLVSRIVSMSWIEIFAGTPLMVLYMRAMGAQIGRNVTLSTHLCTTFDTIRIGDNSSIGAETQLLGYRVERGQLIIGTVDIGKNCFVGMHACLGLDTRMHDNSRLDDLTVLDDGARLASGRGLRGSPAVPARVDVPIGARSIPRSRTRRFLFGVLHLACIYAMGYFLILSMAPSVVVVGATLYWYGPAWGIAAAFASVPLFQIWYALCVIATKRLLIGRIKPGLYRVESLAYVRHWFLQYLLRNTRTILLPMYATLYLPTFLRLLGARIGRDAEISTVTQFTPDLVQIGSGSFLADACLIGGERIHGGIMDLAPIHIGHRTFIGNSALVPIGARIGDDALLGVSSCSPATGTPILDGTRWLGSPAFQLPHTQAASCFADSQTYSPTRELRRTRRALELVRIVLPGVLQMGLMVLFAAFLVMAARAMPLETVVVAIPLAAVALAVLAVVSAALVKRVVGGPSVPTVKPLWSPFVWLNELVNAVYEVVAAPAMSPMMGTPFIAPCLRLMGCKIGRGTFLETTLFSEFDLVEIGDRAALNLGATIQNHLFEDRIFKADRLSIGADATVCNMAVVLYDTVVGRGACVGPLTVVMKGETLSEDTRWIGVPCEPARHRELQWSRPSRLRVGGLQPAR